MTDIIQIQESEYDAILRQAVAVIDKARNIVAASLIEDWRIQARICGQDELLSLLAGSA